MRRAALALSLALAGLPLAACGEEDPADAAGSDGAGSSDPVTRANGATVPLTAWVDKMVADESEPDTVDDKVGIVIDTDDETAFDKLLK